MGFIGDFFRKDTNKKAEKTKNTNCAVLENNFIGGIENPKWEDVKRYIEMMFQDDEEYVTLTLDRVIDGVRFMQACSAQSGYMVQLGIEDESGFSLAELKCDKKAVQKYFKNFFNSGTVLNREKFTAACSAFQPE